LAIAQDRQQWDQSPAAAEVRENMKDIFKTLGLSDTAAEIAARGRPVRGADATDPMFHQFMLFDFECPRISRLLMMRAQRHHLTHVREFEEDLPCEEVVVETDAEPVTVPEFTEMTLHLEYWACQWAVDTLWSWKFNSYGSQMLNADPPEWVRADLDNKRSNEQPFVVRPGWNVEAELQAHFEARVRKALAEYIERSRAFAEARGLVPAQERLTTHFDWLALYQVKGRSWAQIAQWDQDETGSDSKEESAIRKGVQSAAKLVGLNARRGRPGRPPTR
jgi:hypothetical protein